jgi:hypothetical protein
MRKMLSGADVGAGQVVSKTRMIELVKSFDAAAVDAGLTESPQLLAWRGDKGRNWLHLLCGVELKPVQDAAASIETAAVLVRHGFAVSDAAFTEGEWKATPVWFCIARGRNLALAEWLLKQGADPNYSLFAAGWWDDGAGIRLLIRYGAEVDEHHAGEDETPFMGAVKWSRFHAAEELLKHGADVNVQDARGMTALHYMLKKGTDKKHFKALIAAGAKGDLANAEGQTPRQIMSRKKDPDFQRMARLLA